MDAGLERRLLLFIKQDHYLKLCERTLSFAVSLRKEGEVALLESPYELGATARISSSRTEVKQNIQGFFTPFGSFKKLIVSSSAA